MTNKKTIYPELEKDKISEKIKRIVRSLPRELFVSEELREEAYNDYPLPIGCEQTISQPSLVAYMTEALNLEETDRVLEIGTGSGFQAAVLAKLVKEVYTVEIYDDLSKKANSLLNQLELKNVKYLVGDGKKGWKTYAPFDKIIVTATAEEVPFQLVEQLKIGGRMIIPVKKKSKEGEWLMLVEKTKGKPNNPNAEFIITKDLIPVRFVPLT
ncbi:15188_t:CDS:1 [Funneliformis geosporum]|uniref:Protein-L-isoaspartate O-methyltransferase n=1 Tax=Funneliformis geosporum TaxID=1117311 RepID=A0A9W4STW4_9GLOM|nr:15188_t:CDS:1 [Funneliformis geosporum]